MNKIYVSIIIISWNTKDFLRKCLDSIMRKKDNVSFDIWIVDNASSDESPEMVAAEFPSVRIIRNRKNLGFATANNQAIKASSGKYIFLLNPDTEVFRGTINEMVRFMDENERVGALGCKLLNPDGSLQPSCYGSATIFKSFTNATGFHRLIRYGFVTKLLARILGDIFRSWTHFADYDSVLFPDKIAGACMLLRREAITEIGLLNEDFFMYAEDAEFCYRLKQHGWKVAYTPNACIIHYGAQSSKKVWQKMAIEYYKSNTLFFKIHRGLSYAAAFRLAVLFGASIGLLFCLPGLLFNKKVASKRCAYHLEIIKWAVGSNA